MNAKLNLYFVIYLTVSIEFCFITICTSDIENRNSEDFCNGDFIIVSTVDGVITALDIETGQKCWSFLVDAEKFLSSNLAELEIYERGERVFLVPSLDGGLYKYDGRNRVIQPLPIDVDSLVSHSAFLDSSTSFIGGKMKIMFGIHRLTGEVIYSCKLDGCNNFNLPFPENIIVVEEIIQVLNAIDSVKAEKKWHFRVVELKVKLASQAFHDDTSFHNSKENALIPRNFNKFTNTDTYKVSLQSGFAGKINKTNEDFSWLHKTTCPITDAWYLKDNVLKILDPFGKESGYFTVDIDDGKNSVLLFLGLYQNQMFIKKSKEFHVKDVNFNSVSANILYQNFIFPVCPKSENIILVNDSLPEETDLMPTYMNFSVSDHGIYFYTNYSIAENATHCILNASYLVQHEITIPFSFGLSLCIITCCAVFMMIYMVFQLIHDRRALHENVIIIPPVTLPVKLPVTPPVTLPVMRETSVETVAEFRSRFHQDFELISILGKGGFGVVMDVKNKIDDFRHAVKRICLKDQLNSSKYERVMREVKALAKLDHHGIVRYFNAWVEYPPEGWQENKDVEANISDITGSSVEESELTESSLKENSIKDTISTITSTEKSSRKSNLFKKINDNPFKLSDDIFSFHELPGRSRLSTSDDDSWNSNSFENPLDDSFIQFTQDDPYLAEPFQNDSEENSTEKESSEENSTEKESSEEDSTEKESSEENSIEKQSREDSSSSSSTVFQGSYKESTVGTDVSNFDSGEHKESKISKENIKNKEKYMRFFISGDVKNDFFESGQKHHESKSHEAPSYLSSENEKDELKENEASDNFLIKSEKKLPRGYLYIQMQLCQKESLRDWLDQHSDHREYNKVMEIFYQIVDAVHYVHNCGLMHRDLKPSNIYFSMEGAIKIGDFGLATSSEIERENISSSQHLSNIHTSDIGTEFYMSPEQKRKQDYDFKTDIYSLGIIFFELLVPFHTMSERCQVLSKVRRFEFPKEFKKSYKNEGELVQLLLLEDPKSRPTTDEIKQHPLLSEYIPAHK